VPAGSAAAQTRFGLRGGVTVDPDQGHFGFFITTPEFAQGVRFQPSFELGLGDGRTVGAANLDLVHVFRIEGVQPFVGGGLILALYDGNDRGRDSDLEAGVGVAGGIEWGQRFMVELRAGFGDVPELKLTFGILL
jgi:hypothetical protein